VSGDEIRFHKLLKNARFAFTIPVPLVSGLDSYQSDSFRVLYRGMSSGAPQAPVGSPLLGAALR
jgi:hypothetical protein